MRIAAVALVLIVGAAIVLAFANTLNSWVLGGLLGGLAAILLCIPISLAIFMVLTRRHEARQHAAEEERALEEARLAEELYEDELMVYEAEGYALPIEEEQFWPDTRARNLPANPRPPVSGYLSLPPANQEADFYEEDEEPLPRRDPRNYPRQPRYPARSLAPHNEMKPPSPPVTGTTRRPATRSLAQHQSTALHRARQEALQQQKQAQKRAASDSLVRRPQGSRSSSTQRPRTSHSLHAPEYRSQRSRAEDEYDSRQLSTRSSWEEDEETARPFSTEELRERYPQYPRRPAYPRNPRAARSHEADPWTGELGDEEEWEEEPRSRRSRRRDPERLSGNLRNPLVRRAPYLYEDDLLSEEFARQLDNDHPITRRSSLYDHYLDDENE